MLTCLECGQQYTDVQGRCDECGGELERLDDSTVRTLIKGLFSDTHVENVKPETATFPNGGTLRLQAAGTAISLEMKRSYILGRTGDETLRFFVNLDALDAHELGVSRKHAMIRPNKDRLLVMDLGSANGTFLNGKQLKPLHPYTLHNGDRLQFGTLSLRVQYEGVSTNDSSSEKQRDAVPKEMPETPKNGGAMMYRS